MSLLRVENVTVQFGGVTAVNGATYHAEAGTITGLIGPNGAGKTTCFNVITGLQRPTAGDIYLDDHEVTGATVNHRARLGIGRTFQRLEAFGSLSVRDNVRVALDIHHGWRHWRKSTNAAADELLERVGIATHADDRADSIPTGTARLLELARALACEPRLLLLDEPSSGLDETETQDFGELLGDLAGEGVGILMVEHDMDLVMRICSTLYVLDFGTIIATGTPEEIRRNREVQRAYLGYSDESEPPASQTLVLDLGVDVGATS